MTTYYADSVNGNDANPGTLASPKLTAAAALALVTTPGDGISLDGVFREVLNPTVSGFGTGISKVAQAIAIELGTFTFDKLGIPITITSTRPEQPAELTCFKVVTAWEAIDGNGNYRSTVKHRNPMFIRINGEYAKHGASATTSK